MTATAGHFGPLTTIFTPPFDCFLEKWVQYTAHTTVLRWGAACGPATYAYDSSCYPPGWSNATTGRPNYKGFSPGLICPSGWTSAIDGSSIGNSNSFYLSHFVTSLGPHEIATACCPSRYGYNGNGWCTKKSLTFSARPYISTSNNSCATTTVPFFSGAIGHGTTGEATFQARPVVLIRDTRSSYIIPTPTETASVKDPPEGLSTGAKIAIGVCIPVVFLLLAAVLFIWLHRRRHARASTSEDSSGVVVKPSRGDPATGKPELETNAPHGFNRPELEVEGPPKPPVELSTRDSARAELSTRDTVCAELPGNIPDAELPGDDVKGESGHPRHERGNTIP
ncbi:hypothetical protein N7512_004482 [Penicillium capsulatum]|nr:hypothetical protein N7512_004482 [Penicillium capsulatum]